MKMLMYKKGTICILFMRRGLMGIQVLEGENLLRSSDGDVECCVLYKRTDGLRSSYLSVNECKESVYSRNECRGTGT